MKRLLTFTILALFFLASCSSDEGSVSAPEDLGTDAAEQPDYGPLPDVPTHRFELVEDQFIEDPDWVAPDVDGFVMEVTSPDGKPDQVGPLPDGACIPDCWRADGSEKECGDDSCGSICGYCSYGLQCVVDKCEELCVPQCAGKECGFDGCYGTCAPGCEDGFKCGEDFKCYPGCDHDANCLGKQCGPDGCGGSCGICGLGKICDNEEGMCVADPCAGIPVDKGKCVEGVLVECVNGQPKETICASVGPDYHCKYNAIDQKHECSAGCEPQCEWDDGSPKECGYDGCYGTCGTCTSGWLCKAGMCYPQPGGDCGWLTDAGDCFDNVLWYCAGGNLLLEDCNEEGLVCQFVPAVMKFRCQ